MNGAIVYAGMVRAERWGYHITRPARNWSMPSPILPWSKTTIEILPTQVEKSLMQVSSEVAVLEDLSAGLN
jgi:hypothetical protein